MTPSSKFFMVTAPGSLLVLFFFGLPGFAMFFAPCWVFWKVRALGEHWVSAIIFSVLSFWLIAEAILLLRY